MASAGAEFQREFLSSIRSDVSTEEVRAAERKLQEVLNALRRADSGDQDCVGDSVSAMRV
jgi:putative component of toxin-antitoxin plasmid stabilization module